MNNNKVTKQLRKKHSSPSSMLIQVRIFPAKFFLFLALLVLPRLAGDHHSAGQLLLLGRNAHGRRSNVWEIAAPLDKARLGAVLEELRVDVLAGGGAHLFDRIQFV